MVLRDKIRVIKLEEGEERFLQRVSCLDKWYTTHQGLGKKESGTSKNFASCSNIGHDNFLHSSIHVIKKGINLFQLLREPKIGIRCQEDSDD
jgi:hypothetical protein